MTNDTDLNDYIEMLEAELLRKRISDRLHGKLSKLVKKPHPLTEPNRK